MIGPVATPEEEAQLSTDALLRAHWEAGDLRFVLAPHQRACYDKYRAWEQLEPSKQAGNFPRVFVLDIGKRWGKTTGRLVVRFEDCIRNPGRHYRYTTATQKDIEEIVGDVVPRILETCPEDLRPRYQGSTITKEGPKPAGFYFANGSRLTMAGLDKHPDALRGRASDGDDISEAAFVRQLRYTVKNVLYHQYQGRPHARMCLESSAPVEPDTEYDTVFVDDAKARDAYWYGTIDDNTMLSDAEREEFIRAAGGRDHDDCKREYFNIRVRPKESTVVPEFDARKHVVKHAPPKYRYCATAADPGTQDPCAIIWGYWDHERGKLVIQRAWAKSNAGTVDIAAEVKRGEQELFEGVTIYDHGQRLFLPAPHGRWSDVDLRLIYDLSIDHGISFAPTPKPIDTEVGSLRAGLFAIRDAFASGMIEVWPEAERLITELDKGRWNERRTDFERTPATGHLDCLMALVYLWRNIPKNGNPVPPAWLGREHEMFVRPQPPSAIEQLGINGWR